MPLICDGFNVYVPGPNGEKRYPTATSFKIGGEEVYRFTPETGILEISADTDSIQNLIEKIGGLPAAELILPSPLIAGECHFHNVREIKSLPRKDGSFFLSIT